MGSVAEAELLRRLAELETLEDDAVIDSGIPLARIVAVQGAGPYRLSVRLEDGSRVEVDLEGLAYRSAQLTALRDPTVYTQAEIVHEGAALRFAGNEELEIGVDLILALAARQQPMSGADFAGWMRRHGLSDNRAAVMLELDRRTVRGYKVAARVPRHVALACGKFDDDPMLLTAFYPSQQSDRSGGPRKSSVAAWLPDSHLRKAQIGRRKAHFEPAKPWRMRKAAHAEPERARSKARWIDIIA